MSEVDKVTDRTIKEGGVLSHLYFDLHASDDTRLKQLGVGFVQRIIKEPGVVYARGQIDEPMKDEEGKLFSTSVEVKILTKSFADLLRVSAAYSPFSVDILKPDEIKLSIDKAHDMIMNISTITYEYKKYILEKTSTKEDVERHKKNLEAKMKLGERLLKKKEK